MWGLIGNIATLIMGAAAAASLTESLAKAQTRRKTARQFRRGGVILPKEAARELEQTIGGRVVVGQDHDGYLLVVLRTARKRETTIPLVFLNYRVRVHDKTTGALVPPPVNAGSPGDSLVGFSGGAVVIGNIGTRSRVMGPRSEFVRRF